ncbi:tRNA pseudouridine synthase A [Perkinsela sp. CCAP 1560/4]|nr:tRNA pseudouridine synthase A [Perkinsela sp. CCAP 1560/4]|eukprot:KNH01748.1 tRNA pseudouridine synthase A [Perkinsela sp. CCAP 1560/4]
MIRLTGRFHHVATKSATALTTFPLTLLSWNIDQERPNSGARVAKEKRLEKLVACIESIPDVDFVTFQESSKAVPKAMTHAGSMKWLGEAQARTYNGYLQVFQLKSSAWSARVAWQYTGLTFETWPTVLQPLIGEDPWKIDGSALRQIKSPIVRISNIHLDGATINHEIRSSAIRYYTTVPESDIIIGDGQYRSEDIFPPHYADAFVMTGKPAGARYTLDTHENKYFSHQGANYSRSTRAYVRQEITETSLLQGEDTKFPEGHSTPSRGNRPAFNIRATEMKVLKPWTSEDAPRSGVSDHYGLLVRFMIEM